MYVIKPTISLDVFPYQPGHLVMDPWMETLLILGTCGILFVDAARPRE